jgi:hypothetical protein
MHWIWLSLSLGERDGVRGKEPRDIDTLMMGLEASSGT